MGSKIVLLLWLTVSTCVMVSGNPQISPKTAPSLYSSAPEATATGKTKGFEISHGYSFNAAANSDGDPYSSGWAYMGGRMGNGPTYLTDNTGFLPTDLWSGRSVDLVSGGLYLTAGVVALSSLYYTFSPLVYNLISKKNSTEAATTGKPKKSENLNSTETTKEAKKTSRRLKRETTQTSIQADADLTHLASIVLNAIASGECLQKTICQIGTQIGGMSKGRFAFNLIDTMLPTSVHANQYFVTMKKALKGEAYCGKFNCKYEY